MTIEDECDIGTIDVEYERQLFDMRQLLEISKSLNSNLDYPTLIDSILYTCMAQLKVVRAALFAKRSLDVSRFCLVRNCLGCDLTRLDDYSIPGDHGIIRLLADDPHCHTLDEIVVRLGSAEGLEALTELGPSLVVPLNARGALVGVIVLGERIDCRSFDRYERERALNIAVFASIAIHNAYLFDMSTTDMMTKLKMRHFFSTVLQERLAGAARTGTSLCLIMMDIDRFKRVNDTFGHTCGDAVIVRVAEAIRENVRSEDVAARYGGEEFAVLLSGSETGEACAVAERIRAAVAAARVEGFCAEGLRVTISSGVARFDPRRDLEPKDFIDRSDRALYRSKQEGRNRVSLAD
jgi:diguanylate cyclase (GGDEF)-like protein